MTKNFNTLLSIDEIITAYTYKMFPNAHCLLWNKEVESGIEILSTEQDNIAKIRKEITIDG